MTETSSSENQISQYDLPMSRDGYLEIRDPKGRFEPRRIRIIRTHLEEDAGKSMHDEVAGKADSRIDLNRTGTPLLDIVKCPSFGLEWAGVTSTGITTALRIAASVWGCADERQT